jgi:hypothetical protein
MTGIPILRISLSIMALYRDFADLIALKQKARSRIAWALLSETSSWEANFIHSLISISKLRAG